MWKRAVVVRMLELIMHKVCLSFLKFIDHTTLHTQFKTIKTIPTNHPLLIHSSLVLPNIHTFYNLHFADFQGINLKESIQICHAR